ncbi:MAG: hypothetical protein CMD58_03930 [Gammaproteobacteria bacterium]|nr:hypothetical protein [Gammaproteobacteria bacterium]|tara:strand:- start:305 stop:1336 length:1032 start_codon:yes stop_codon:yes gene_type:complete
MFIKMNFIKYILFSLIIISNTCFGKEFDKLFVVYEPIQNSAEIEKSINSAFNTMIYRLSGTSSPSTVWKIINSGNSRKDFIKSYSIKTSENKNYLEVAFDKNTLIRKFEDLSIPFVDSSRPLFLIILKIDNGIEDPYFFSYLDSKSTIDLLIKNNIDNLINTRGVFIQTPEFDLIDVDQFSKYEKLIDLRIFLSSKYQYDEIIEVSITKSGIDAWSISGDISLLLNNTDFQNKFISSFNSKVEERIDAILSSRLINIKNTDKVELIIKNINYYDDYIQSKKIIENFIAVKNFEIKKFNVNAVTYDVEIYGNYNNFLDEISDNNFFKIINSSSDVKSINLSFEK